MAQPQPADIIWRQVSPSTKAACGAREPVSSNEGNTLYFRVTISRNKTHKIEVTYDRGRDSYTVKLHYIRGGGSKVEQEATDVYADRLNDTIYRFCNT